MGIRFCCPNGHRLHVKSFQAGKRGVCPQCGIKIEIPWESDPEGDEGAKSSPTEDPAPPRSSPSDVPGEPHPAAPAVVAPHRATTPAAEPAEAHRSETAPVVTEAAAPAPADPIAEAPHAIWYVQPPSGGQYGPASGDIMRTWIAEGRVTRDSLVWREGWAEWKLAGPLFPGLLAGPAIVADPEAVQIVTDLPTGSVAEQYRRRKSTKSALTIVVLLVVACLVLFATLIYVVNYVN